MTVRLSAAILAATAGTAPEPEERVGRGARRRQLGRGRLGRPRLWPRPPPRGGAAPRHFRREAGQERCGGRWGWEVGVVWLARPYGGRRLAAAARCPPGGGGEVGAGRELSSGRCVGPSRPACLPGARPPARGEAPGKAPCAGARQRPVAVWGLPGL